MSRIGKQPIVLPEQVTITVDGQTVGVKGPKGELRQAVPRQIKILQTEAGVSFERKSNLPATRALHGLSRSLVANMVQGVTEGYEKRLELVGTGYRVAAAGAGLTLNVGLSHSISVQPTPGVELKTEGNNVIIVTGIDKQAVGQMAANIRKLRPPEPYNGKGIRYQGEAVRRKPGKAAKVAG
jgi:large subunit ribosomal protein L6